TVARPSFASSADTVDLPDAMPPRRPSTTLFAGAGRDGEACVAAGAAGALLFRVGTAGAIAWGAGFFTGGPGLRGALGRGSNDEDGRRGVRPGGFQPANEAGRSARLEGVGGGPLRVRAHAGGRCEAAR